MIKVLIIEDDPMVRQINEKFLEKIEGFCTIDSVSSISDAKELLMTNEPELVLLDLFFPNEKGLDLLKWMRLKDLKTDTILITADNSVNTIEECLRYGAIDYLIKPFTYDRFKEALERYRSRKKKLNSQGNIEQEDLDRYVFNEVEGEKEGIMEDVHFSKQTYDKVLEYLNSQKDKSFTAQEVANYLGVSRITARRYLDLLEKESVVTMNLEYGKVGRPKNKYRIK
jgi:response regulator of citrate/malate metabolism